MKNGMKMTTPASPKDYVILILSYTRPEFLKTHTWGLLDTVNSHARRVVVLSDDDKTVPEYRKIYGDDSIFIFNKEEAEKRYDMDLVDCYWGKSLSRKATVWARNEQFRIARELGYRWFIVLDDDYVDVVMRRAMISRKTNDVFFPRIRAALFAREDKPELSVFDECCLKYFNLLESAPWMYITAFSQIGDFIGGVSSVMARYSYRWKAMNVFFGDTRKEYRYYGRFNDDVNAYILNGKRGQLSLTLDMPSIDQTPTQQASGGITDMYKMFGTYVKSIPSAVICPSSVAVSCMGSSCPRVHHSVEWSLTCPLVVDSSFCKGIPLDYSTECMNDTTFLHPEERKASFLDKTCEMIDDVSMSSSSIDSFF